MGFQSHSQMNLFWGIKCQDIGYTDKCHDIGYKPNWEDGESYGRCP